MHDIGAYEIGEAEEDETETLLRALLEGEGDEEYEIGDDDDDDDYEIEGDDDDEFEIGDDGELTGPEFFEEVGARRRRRRPRRRIRRVARRRPARRIVRRAPRRIARRRMPTTPMPVSMRRGGLVVKEKRPSEGRVLYLGFDSGADVAAGASSDVLTRPQDVFSPRKLQISPAIADAFVIVDAKVGNISQFSSGTAAVPGAAFIPDAWATDLKWDTAQVSQDILLRVTNVSAAAVRFRAAMIGFVARQ